MTGTIFNIMRCSINDGPGIRTTVFFKGCPLACPWCHNPESVAREREIVLRDDRCIRCGDCIDSCTSHAISARDGVIVTDRSLCLRCGDCIPSCYAGAREAVGREVSVDEVMHEIVRDRVFYDRSSGGATFSGGEPFLQHEFLMALLEACKRLGIHTAVDTSGCTSPSILERAAPFVDLFLYDMKVMDDQKHTAFTGVSNVLLLENLRRLTAWGKEVIVRIPVIPGLNDDPENIRRSGEWLSSLRTIREVHVLPYHTSGTEKYARLGRRYALGATPTPDQLHLATILNELRHHISRVTLGG